MGMGMYITLQYMPGFQVPTWALAEMARREAMKA